MKKYLLASLAVAAFSTEVCAAANDLRLMIRNNINSVNLAVDVPTTPGVNGIVGYDSSSTLGRTDGGTGSYRFFNLGAGMSYTSGVVSVANVPQSSITGLTADLANKQDYSLVLDELSALPMNSNKMIHIDAFGDLIETDMFAPGVAMVGASSYANMRSLMGLGNVDNTSDLAKPVSTATQTALNAKFNTPSGTTSQYVRGDGSLATFPSTGGRTFNYPSRALNSCFQISATQDADFHYKVDVSTGLSLTTGAQGTVTATSYTNSGCSTGAQVLVDGTSSQTGTLIVGLGINQVASVALDGMVPAGRWVRISTANTVGSPTFAIRAAQSEVLLP